MRALAAATCLAVCAACLLGCTGLALGVNAPGGDTHLGARAIAVDDRTDATFVLRTPSQETVGASRGELAVVDPDSGRVRQLDASLGADARLLFPKSGVLLMSEHQGGEQLTLFDEQTLTSKRTAALAARYHGTRSSPSRAWVAVADNDSSRLPIHLLNASTLEARAVPHGGQWLEAAWLRGTDELVAAIFADTPQPELRVASWRVADVSRARFATDATGAWAAPRLDVRVPGVRRDTCVSFTWVAVSPDERYVAVPVRDAREQRWSLVVVDARTGSHRVVPGAKGPVGFSADGGTIVSYGEPADAPVREGCRKRAPTRRLRREAEPEPAEHLLLIDTETLVTRAIELPGLAHFNFHVSGSHITVASYGDSKQGDAAGGGSGGHAPLWVLDVGTPGAAPKRIGGVRAHLHELIERPRGDELWLIAHDRLLAVTPRAASAREVALPFAPSRINYLPGHDWIALRTGSGERDVLGFYDPKRGRLVRTVALEGSGPHARKCPKSGC